MKSATLIPLGAALLAALLAAPAAAQNRIWRCSNNVFTNDAAEASARGCKPFEGGNVTVIEGTRVNGAATPRSDTRPAARSGVTPVAAPRSVSPEQRARDEDARLILQAELKKAQDRLAALRQEYNNGEPEKLGPETRNHQKYLDRVAELKANIARTEQDIAGLQRELARFGGSAATVR